MHRFSIFFLFILISCSSNNSERIYNGFFDHDKQPGSERTFRDGPEPYHVLNFSEMELFRPGNLEHNDTHLFLTDFAEQAVIKVSKKNPQDVQVFRLSEGKGPGEVLSVQGFAVNNERIVVGDQSNKRYVVLDTDGNHLQDVPVKFNPTNIRLTDDNRVTSFSPIQQPFLFMIYSPEGDSLGGFGPPEPGIESSMKYTGYFRYADGNIFVAGYSESLIRKYNMDGDILFSRSTIDDYDTTGNYENRSTDQFRAFGFSDDALFSTRQLAVYGNLLYLIPHHNGDSSRKFIDLYNAENGTYKESLRLDVFARDLAADEQHLYILANVDDEATLRFYSRH